MAQVPSSLATKLALLLVLAGVASCAKPADPSNSTQGGDSLPKMGVAYGRAVASLPDWDGNWVMTGGTERSRLMFDADNAYEPPDPAGAIGGDDFGPRGGSYDKNIPYKPEYQQLYAHRIQMALEGEISDPLGACMQPHGFPRQMGGIPMAPEIIMTPGMILMSWSYMGAQRRIYTDGRPHPPAGEAAAEYMGHSVGQWDGETLLVDTVDILPGIYDMSGAPFSDQIHVIERIHLIEKDVLEDQMTIEDPVMLEHSWQVTRRYHRANIRHPNFSMEYCAPGTAVDFSEGYQKVVLPSEVKKAEH
jgi:hypothetical protein